ncbi:PREDICTED: proline-rich protein HaeIII subfamily 1-like [Vollenhovia emeryi]|uniref:proline-rich protein HaeIII subfamily 1-like n=1 Tax=Vollenhovia emeryi TaxID=411798 RepID=UPI0005F397E8|nr:PREDICTED: proline-rich protein HaeIII subfamily 1-like [Vollenhovia emeryi]
MGRSRRAGHKVQLRRIAREYATSGVFDPSIFDRALEPPQPSLPRHPPPHSNPPVAPRHPQPPPPYRPPDPCPTRTWAPRPPVTPAPRPPRASLASAPPAPPAGAAKKPPLEPRPQQQPRPRQPSVAPPRTRPCIVRIEALPQRIRVARRPRTQLQAANHMPSLG